MKEVTDVFQKKGGVLLEQRMKFISLHALHLSMGNALTQFNICGSLLKKHK